ncbi:histidine phosphatase superfamily [Xylaria bambusicola]|uniref:histidine phosphatase superfamily n=1 Tax=Xylaria bambusicola TaxID=326684 RepID=UPI0020081430|nr:histidine phosphatase superfamily [Xylaria bambusicola]KAI0527808.1 histidine phosphatase superfamily [Xylaria bambusicola]
MSLEVIYVVRHGFRSAWSVDPVTGTYTAHIRSPTGLPTDPALTSHGVEQANELAVHLLGLNPPIDQVYSSPYYRCLQTISPFVSRHNDRRAKVSVSDDDIPSSRLSINVDAGLGEWYGQAHFEHPTSAPLSDLHGLFADIDPKYVSSPAPRRRGESIPQLYQRVSSCIERIIAQCDREGRRSVLISTHAAVVIVLGRLLTGMVPDDTTVEDFRAFTCGLSTYRRQMAGQDGRISLDSRERGRKNNGGPYQRPAFDLSTRWTSETNSDCSFLRLGEERGWTFSGDESFVELGQEDSPSSTTESQPNTAVRESGDSSSHTNISKL